MFDIFAAGARILTCDDVGEALLDCMRELNDQGRTETFSFPALMDGQASQAWVTVGAGIPIAAVRTDPEVPLTLEGQDFAAWSLRRRAAVLAGQARGGDWDEP